MAGRGGHGGHLQFDTRSVLPYYLYLAVTGAFIETIARNLGSGLLLGIDEVRQAGSLVDPRHPERGLVPACP